jgi:hypothetical protein
MGQSDTTPEDVRAGLGETVSSSLRQPIALSLIEALNARDLSHPGVAALLNKTASTAYHQRFVTAFPDLHFEVLRVLEGGDTSSSIGRGAAPTPSGWLP